FAPFVIGRLADAFGWRTAFMLLGLLGVVWAVVFYAWFRDTPAHSPACNEAERNLILFGAAESPVTQPIPPLAGTGPPEGIVTPEETVAAGPPPDPPPLAAIPEPSAPAGGHSLPPLRPLLA